ncbi:hypothetical protein ACGFIJ_32490 [Microbispora bryophytorum]|uniref:hypothetical protein n=1 Tax=Microbispora bryophytorum TaxID=1460882 RepID=UPI0037138C73
MIWVTWRQHRPQIFVTAAFLALLGVLLLGSAVEASWYVSAHARPGCSEPALSCGDLAAALARRYDAVYSVFGWMPLVAPALIGAFWGAPLLGREYERGTHRLAWTQSVPVWRWLAVKLSVLGGMVVAGGLLLSLMVSLWRPVFRAGGDSTFGNIGVFNMVGVEPARIELSGTVVLDDRDARLVRAAWVEPSGREVAEPTGSGCARRVDAGQSSKNAEAWQACLFGKGYRYAVYYQPPSRFWRFQWTEAGILTLASAALGGLAVRRTLRRPG